MSSSFEVLKGKGLCVCACMHACACACVCVVGGGGARACECVCPKGFFAQPAGASARAQKTINPTGRAAPGARTPHSRSSDKSVREVNIQQDSRASCGNVKSVKTQSREMRCNMHETSRDAIVLSVTLDTSRHKTSAPSAEAEEHIRAVPMCASSYVLEVPFS